jgi:S-DNA-T family DNA segregation ATPase FtsK/SpoIIIE
MATAAERARKRDLGPDWRDKLHDSVRLLVVRTVGTLLVAGSLALGVALATHDAVDPSFSTAAGGPPVNWVGSAGAYSSDLLLMLFGPAAVLFLPVLAVAGLRMMRGDSAGRLGRALLVAAVGIVLAGIALAMVRGTAVSGLPGGWGGALGYGGARAIDAGVDQIGNPDIEGPLRMALMALLAVGGLILAWFALGLREEEKGWIGGLFRRNADQAERPPRRTVEERDTRDNTATPPRARPTVAVAEPARPVAPASARKSDKGRRLPSQASLALGDDYVLPALDLLSPPPPHGKTQVDRAGLERNARLL